MSPTKAQPTTTGVFQATAQWGGEWWALTVRDHPGIFSQARSLAKAASMVAEAIELFLDLEPGSATVVVTPDLPLDLHLSIIESRRLTTEATHLQQTAAALSNKVAADLMAAGLTQRDAATAMGISSQRLNQLIHRTVADSGDDGSVSAALDSSRSAMDQLTAAAARSVEGRLSEFAEAAKESSESAREAIRDALAHTTPTTRP